MKTQLTVDLDQIKDLLNNLAENHGDVEIDLDIIESIVAGWSSGGHKPSLKFIADRLTKLASELIETHELLED
jgi:hypothetical protein